MVGRSPAGSPRLRAGWVYKEAMFRARLIAAGVVAAALVAACESGAPPAPAATPTATPLPPPVTPSATSLPPTPTATVGPDLPEIDLGRLYQVLETDEIEPIYDPIFETAGRTRLGDEQLVMGVAIDGEAKAYPISILHIREMVNDEVGGTPVLVTW